MVSRFIRFQRLFLTILVFSSSLKKVYAKPLPIWELGLGVAYLQMPDYHGSDEIRSYVLPMPIGIYRGDLFKADDSGLVGNLLAYHHLRLNFSFGAGLPVNSQKNKARKGMSSLDPTLEFGPALKWEILKNKNSKFLFTFPVRGVLSTNFSHTEYRGIFISPHLHFRFTAGERPASRYIFNLVSGPMYGDRMYNEYYYTVLPKFANSTRAQYRATAGFAGYRLNFSVNIRRKTMWYGTFLRYESLENAVFRPSPLVKSADYLAIGLACAHFFLESRQLVSRLDL